MDRGRLVREVDADRRLEHLLPAGWFQVRLQDEIGSRRQRPGHVLATRHFARRPTQEVPVREVRAGRVHPFEPRSRLVEIPLA